MRLWKGISIQFPAIEHFRISSWLYKFYRNFELKMQNLCIYFFLKNEQFSNCASLNFVDYIWWTDYILLVFAFTFTFAFTGNRNHRFEHNFLALFFPYFWFYNGLYFTSFYFYLQLVINLILAQNSHEEQHLHIQHAHCPTLSASIVAEATRSCRQCSDCWSAGHCAHNQGNIC